MTARKSALASHWPPSPAVAISFVALLLAAGGASYALIPATDGSVTACLTKDGDLKVIDPASGRSCQGSQVTLRLASVDSAGKVANADKLDGKNASDFIDASGPVDADTLDTLDSSAFAQLTNGKVGDADKLDGKDSSDFLTSGSSLNADTLDGKDSSDFLGVGAAAGGSLTGSYPNPSIGNLAVTAGKLGTAAVGLRALNTAEFPSNTLGFSCNFQPGYCYPPEYEWSPPWAFTPSANGKCLVTANAIRVALGSSRPTNAGPYVSIAVKRGTTDDATGSAYAPLVGGQSESSAPLTLTEVLPINAGETTRFGIHLMGIPYGWSSTAAFPVSLSISYLCL